MNSGICRRPIGWYLVGFGVLGGVALVASGMPLRLVPWVLVSFELLALSLWVWWSRAPGFADEIHAPDFAGWGVLGFMFFAGCFMSVLAVSLIWHWPIPFSFPRLNP